MLNSYSKIMKSSDNYIIYDPRNFIFTYYYSLKLYNVINSYIYVWEFLNNILCSY